MSISKFSTNLHNVFNTAIDIILYGSTVESKATFAKLLGEMLSMKAGTRFDNIGFSALNGTGLICLLSEISVQELLLPSHL